MIETHHGQTSTFVHDLGGQLTSADHSLQTDEGYSYDPNGNRTAPASTSAPTIKSSRTARSTTPRSCKKPWLERSDFSLILRERG
jgi:YD repeat-containing protein